MPALLIGLLALALMLWLVKSFARSDPRYLAMIMARIGRTAGGVLTLASAAFLLVRGQIFIALPLGLIGLGLLGWQPAHDLLAAYLHGRPAPRPGEDPDNAAAGRRGAAPSSGKMTEQEAYQILGLQPGASAEDVARAHRGLIKKLHPDQGGSTYLAARVNEAKDVLSRRNQ
jgi:hypothetical protein